MMISVGRPLRLIPAIALAITALVTADLATQSRRGRTSVLVDGREAVDGEVLVQFRDDAAGFEQARASDEIDAGEVESLGRRGSKRMRSRTAPFSSVVTVRLPR